MPSPEALPAPLLSDIPDGAFKALLSQKVCSPMTPPQKMGARKGVRGERRGGGSGTSRRQFRLAQHHDGDAPVLRTTLTGLVVGDGFILAVGHGGHTVQGDLLLVEVATDRLGPLFPDTANPFPWMSEAMDLKKEKNFFETRVIEYQTGSSLKW